MLAQKRDPLRRMVHRRTYDPQLSTRKDGTGTSLLAVANAVANTVARFVGPNHHIHDAPHVSGSFCGSSALFP